MAGSKGGKMKLRNKKTGQTGYYLHTHRDYKNGHIKIAVLEDGKPFSEFKPYEPLYDYDTLEELNNDWEDEEKPKEHYYISDLGEVQKEGKSYINDITPEKLEEIGNYFEAKEEAERAVEKLKAWKRLKDDEFRFKTFYVEDREIVIRGGSDIASSVEMWHDLDLLFGGEE